MEISNKLTSNELFKAGKLLCKASELGMDVSGYGELDVNKTSGNVYLWLEDYQFALFIAPCGDWDVQALYSCPIDGDETVIDCPDSMAALDKWCSDLSAQSEAKEG